MICVVQRVTQASVTVDERVVGQIARGMLVLAAVHRDDTDADIAFTAGKLVSLRIFPAGDKNFDMDVRDIEGGILLVSNFTVAAATRHGRRPSLDAAASPEAGRLLFDRLVATVRQAGVNVQTGQFGAHMRVSLDNDGPITFLVDSREARSA
jgi:D-tyrosyl-tRNA(Tyr) deacylase